MKNSRSCVGLVFLAVILALLAVLGYVIVRGTTKVNKEGNTPPTIFVNSPVANQSIEAGSFIFVNVTATGQNPIARIELWMDGSLLETQMPEAELGEVTTFYTVVSIPMTEGPHMFSARAVDSKGLVGQSLPIAVQGIPRSQPEPVPTGPNPGPAPANPSSTNSPATGSTTGSTPQPPVATLPPATLPVTPPGVAMVTAIEYKPVDINSILPILLSGRPKAPTSLQAGYENCKIRLVWTDKASDETHFNVWMQALGGPPSVILILKGSNQTGPTWHEFDSPPTGIYSFWIEAVNALGGQSSEIAWVGVTDLNCGSKVSSDLSIEIMDMNVQGGYDQVYCYLSVEGAPEKRTPATDGKYVQVLGGSVDVSNWTGNGNKILLPVPADYEVRLEGKCLGRKGGAKPETLGTFTASAPKETWDGRRMELIPTGSTAYTIGYNILPLDTLLPARSNSINTFDAFPVFVPYDLRVEIDKAPPFTPANQNPNLQSPTLHWKWDGKEWDITGFTIYVNDVPFMQAPSYVRSASLRLPGKCGGSYKFSVAANFPPHARSFPSQPVKHEQMDCQLNVEVKFETVRFSCLDDDDQQGIPHVWKNCNDNVAIDDSIEAYYDIYAGGYIFDFEGVDLTTHTDYAFSTLGSKSDDRNRHSSYDTFIIPIEVPPSRHETPVIRFGLHMKDSDWFLDPDDAICFATMDLRMPYSEWLRYDKTLKLTCSHRDSRGWLTVQIKGFEVAVPGRNANPGLGPPVGP